MSQYTYKPMLTVELPEKLYKKMCSLISIEEIDEIEMYDALTCDLIDMLAKVQLSQPVPTKSEEQLFYYLFATKNFKKEPTKFYRVILEDDGKTYQYCFITKEGKINRTDDFENISTLKMEQIPERFKPFAIEVK